MFQKFTANKTKQDIVENEDIATIKLTRVHNSWNIPYSINEIGTVYIAAYVPYEINTPGIKSQLLERLRSRQG